MLPDYPEEKQKLLEIQTDYLNRKTNQLLGPFSQAEHFMHHEGNRWRIERSDGSISESEYNTIQGEFSVSVDEAPTLTPEKIKAKLDTIADQMASKMSKEMFATFAQAADEAGNSINAAGQPLTKDMFLEMISRIEIDFDKDGKPIMPTVFVPPGFDSSVLDEWNKDPEMGKKHEEIMNKKKEDWNEREACRKLVD
jgi:hypothetical protein